MVTHWATEACLRCDKEGTFYAPKARKLTREVLLLVQPSLTVPSCMNSFENCGFKCW
ncbi:hypothetical protein OESDEN_25466 [Oesophagostomum dentatum]|uniref:Uncharacterized protein n=1 Tax=Oesophagostomum dentatum TaxID=61180 RepID=A0A0B1RPD4_OESDE|nr:hypothetical protein OESDEN_25466 [Oesophagostomum dentatum]